MKDCNFSDLVGKTIISIDGAEKDSVEIILYCKDKNNDSLKYLMQHYQECCEIVYVEDICGDINDILGSEILFAEEVSNRNSIKPQVEDASFTWTFYKIDTVKGGVTIRWYGESSGYYSESVDFEEIT
jgi:hypothetical protein